MRLFSGLISNFYHRMLVINSVKPEVHGLTNIYCIKLHWVWFFDRNYLKCSNNFTADCNLKLQNWWSLIEKFAPISLLILVLLLLAIFEKLAVLRALSHLVLLKLKDFRNVKNMHSSEWQDWLFYVPFRTAVLSSALI